MARGLSPPKANNLIPRPCANPALRTQDHYDFGMRAVKSILVMAGSLKRAEPDLPEDMLLIRAMRDSNIPKFLVEDAILFMALVKDLFPTVEIVDARNTTLEEAIKVHLKENNYEAHDPFVEKILQLQETMIVRHGIMVRPAPPPALDLKRRVPAPPRPHPLTLLAQPPKGREGGVGGGKG